MIFAKNHAKLDIGLIAHRAPPCAIKLNPFRVFGSYFLVYLS